MLALGAEGGSPFGRLILHHSHLVGPPDAPRSLHYPLSLKCSSSHVQICEQRCSAGSQLLGCLLSAWIFPGLNSVCSPWFRRCPGVDEHCCYQLRRPHHLVAPLYAGVFLHGQKRYRFPRNRHRLKHSGSWKSLVWNASHTAAGCSVMTARPIGCSS